MLTVLLLLLLPVWNRFLIMPYEVTAYIAELKYIKMMIGSVNYAGVNVRVWYMFSGSVQHMTALEIISWLN